MEEDIVKTIAKGSGIIFLGIVFSKIFGYIYRLIIARIGVEQYGTLSLGIVIVGIVIMFSSLGLDFGVLRYVSYFIGKGDNEKIKGVINSALKISIPISIIFSLLLFVFSGKIAYILFNNINLSLILKILSICIPFYITAKMFISVLVSFKKIKYVIYAQYLSESLLKVLITILFIVLGYGIIGAAIAYVLAVLCMFGLSFYFLQKRVFSFLDKNINGFFSNKVLLLFSLPLLFSNLIEVIIGWADSIMIGIFKGSYFVGIYNAAVPTSVILLMIPLALLYLYLPLLTQLYSNNNTDKMKYIYKLITRWVFLLNLPLFLLMTFFSKQILSILFGVEYSIGSLSLIILCLGYFIYSIFYINQQILFVIKKTNLIFINVIIAASVNIILNYILIQRYGIIGGAISATTALIIISILCLIESNRFINLGIDLISYIKYAISGFCAILLVYIIGIYINISSYILKLIILSLIFFLCYLGLMYLIKGLHKEDMYLLHIIKNKLNFKNLIFKLFNNF